MIGRLCGILLAKHPPELLLEVSGVGYELLASMNTFYKLPEINSEVILHTHLIIREDAHLLFGFYDMDEKKLFRELIKINGVGPKLALSILSSMKPEEIILCFQNQDVLSLTRIPGVGKKTAERLILDMQDRIKNWQSSGLSLAFAGASATGMRSSAQDAISALIALGYKPLDSAKIINSLSEENQALSSEELIRAALKQLGR